MKDTKRFKDFECWDKIESIKSTEELVKILTRLEWGMYWEGIRVQFFDLAKEDLVFGTLATKKNFFETLGEVSPEEIEYIIFYSKDCNFELENEGSAWTYGVGCSTFEEDLYRDKINAEKAEKLKKNLISTNYGKDEKDKQIKNLISTNYGKNNLSEEDN